MKIGIFGSSGFAREVADIALCLGHAPVLIQQDNSSDIVSELYSVISAENCKFSDFDGFTIGIGSNHLREKVYLDHKNLEWVNLIHPSVSFGHGMGEVLASSIGVIACTGTRITNSIQIGNFNILNLNSTVGHDCILEDFVNLSPGAHVSGNVKIEKLSWLGTNCSINNGSSNNKLKIRKGSTIGSGAVVTKSLNVSGVYVGSPARLLK